MHLQLNSTSLHHNGDAYMHLNFTLSWIKVLGLMRFLFESTYVEELK